MTPEQDIPELPEIAGFRLIREIARSARGVVYKARDLSDQSFVAIKISAAGAAPTLLREPQPAVPGMARLRTSGWSGGRSYAVMDFADGEPLTAVLAREHAPDAARACDRIRRAALALGRAAELGLCHGALHPGDLIVCGDDVTVTGVGMSSGLPPLSEGAAPSGAWIYAAPEVLEEKGAIAASDLYSLGAILFHLLTGDPPFRGGSLSELRLARKESGLRWPADAAGRVPAECVSLVNRLTVRDPAQRPTHRVVERELGRLFRPPSKSGAAPSARTGLWALVGGSAVVAALGLALMIRALTTPTSVSQPMDSTPTTPPSAPTKAPGTPDTVPSPDDAAERGWRAIEAYIRENSDWRESPAKRRALAIELEKLARLPTHTATLRANQMMAEIAAIEEHADPSHRLNAALTESERLEKEARFGQALAAIRDVDPLAEGRPEWARRLVERMRAVAVAARTEADRIGSEADRAAADGRFNDARAGWRRASEKAEWPEFAERARAALEQLDRREADIAAQRIAAERARRLAELQTTVRTMLPAVKSNVASFQYEDAARQMDVLIGKFGADAAELRADLEAYRTLLAAERQAAEIGFKAYNADNSTKDRLLLRHPSGTLTFQEITAAGMQLRFAREGGTVQERWESFEPAVRFKIMKHILPLEQGEQLLALATWCFHQDLRQEADEYFAACAQKDERLVARRDATKALLMERLGPYFGPVRSVSPKTLPTRTLPPEK